jgi:hypothetical protein
MIKSRRIRWAGYVARTREECIQNSLGNPEGKRPLGRTTWEDNIKMDLREKD